MYVIGIAGGIGAGKSVVSRVLRSKGHEVYDCDSEARRMMEASDLLKADIAARLGDSCISADGSLDRREIAKCIFGDDSCREWLNSRVHRMVREDVARRASSASEGILFVESAILKSSGLCYLCDRIWIVDAPEEVRIERACARDGSDRDSVKARIEAQRDEESGFDDTPVDIIRNDGLCPVLPEIEKLLTSLKQ